MASNNGTIFVIGLAILIVLIYGGNEGWFKSVVNIKNTNNIPDPTGLEPSNYVTLSLNPDEICTGDSSKGTIVSAMDYGSCGIYTNLGEGWQILDYVNLDENGDYEDEQVVSIEATISFVAVCCDADNSNCKMSNIDTLKVEDCIDPDKDCEKLCIAENPDYWDGGHAAEDQYDCDLEGQTESYFETTIVTETYKCCCDRIDADTSDCSDSDGNDRYKPGFVTDSGTTYYDECLEIGEAVTEYTCVDGNVFSENLACDYGEVCVATRSGGYCEDAPDNYELGDTVFYYGKDMSPLEGSYGVELQLGSAEIKPLGEGQCLGARIGRSWDYLVPGCEGDSGMVNWMLMDSNSLAWEAHDVMPISTTEEVCPTSWNGQNWNFNVFTTKSPNCPIEFEYSVTAFVCECP